MLTPGSGLVADLVDPFPGRLARSLEISIACALVVLVSMTFQIPDPATSTYIIFFAAKEDLGLNILTSIILIVVVTVVIAITFGLALLSLNSPDGRILVIAAVSFITFFLGGASKLAPLASTIGLIIAYALDLFGSTPFGEITTRGLLYAWLFVAVPMLVFIAYNLLFGRSPARLLREAVARRLRAASTALRKGNDENDIRLAETCKGGNEELLKALKVAGLFHLQSANMAKRLRALLMLSYNLTITVLAMNANGEFLANDQFADRIDRAAADVEKMGDFGRQSSREETDPPRPGTLREQIVSLVDGIEDVVGGGPVPDFPAHALPGGKTGFFSPDAFTNPDHVRFAFKGATAVMICYLTFTLLDWPGIHTSMLTCFIVGLTTVGETVQKLSLRIVGCCVGAAAGLLAIVYVVPNITSITSLLLLIGVVTLPAAWVAVGRPSVSYIGFQAAFALYLCILQGDEPKFDLTIIRDRTIGIIFGNVVIYVIYTRVFPVSVLGRVREELIQLIDRCREVLRSVAQAAPAIETACRAAEMQASLEEIESSALALGYETLRSSSGRPQRQAIRRSVEALRRVTDSVCKVAAYPPPLAEQSLVSAAVRTKSEGLEARLEAIASSFSDEPARDPEAEPDTGSEVRANGQDPVGADSSWTGRAASFDRLALRIDALSIALLRYRRLSRAEMQIHA
jgi:multidrug resistance protein MdtO